MVENKGMLFLAGHHHQGDLLHSFRSTTSEFILGAFHGRDSFIEQIRPDGIFYILVQRKRPSPLHAIRWKTIKK